MRQYFRTDKSQLRSALIIVAVVAVSCLLETALLFSALLHPWYGSGNYPPFVALSQLLLIPAIAALISWAMNGSHRLAVRTVRILLGGVLAVPAAVILMLIIFSALWALGWCYEMNRILFVVILAVELCVLVLVSRLFVQISSKWGINAEAERWLFERQTRAALHKRASRNRAVKAAVCIPVLTVLLIFLFLPETLGLVSHVSQPRVAELSGYLLKIPWTWAVNDYRVKLPDGRSWVAGMAGRGIARGTNPWRWDSMSGWTFGTKSYDGSDEDVTSYALPKKYKVVEQRVFTIGNEQIVCIDYQPLYDWPTPDWYQMIAHVSCSGPGRLSASLDGSRTQVRIFYNILTGVAPAPVRVLAP